ncbi:DUF1697 domain-containing protein [Planococcus kocurii]|uniref:DUF1697 domain-containing protein n=1 Tax=Planococcus kocurii TaxID=1374 RepID=A0ABM5WYR7_9BACL|nr:MULTISPECIES: DUF1697 domain-containing protein [Planococcus]ALS79497.1 hypothetical protein AUO94_13080 [Planococcus kocurii]KAA0956988.1 DUF1697 domain-containing protein [Planococcus sp. ANT_H30]
MLYVALLRGINVGGKNKIEMKLLKQAFEELGMSSVVTYINSGNIIFANPTHSEEQLAERLEETIYSHFNLRIHLLIYSAEAFRKIAQAIPEQWTNDSQMKSDVLFLWQDVDHEAVLDRLTIHKEVDRVFYVPGAILWSVNKDKVSTSGMVKVAGTTLYRHVTVRNVNTVRKILMLL